jgi:TonB family protein
MAAKPSSSIITTRKGGAIMTERRLLRPFAIVACAVSVGLLAAPLGASLGWASTDDKPRMMNKKPTMKAPATPASPTPAPQMMTQSPTTLDSYIDYVSDKLQVEAMKVRHEGSADVKLTIEKSGAVKLAEVVRVNGPAALRDEALKMVDLMGSLPPLPPDANVDVLVLTSTVVFNYPGQDMFDRHGRRTSTRRE